MASMSSYAIVTSFLFLLVVITSMPMVVEDPVSFKAGPKTITKSMEAQLNLTRRRFLMSFVIFHAKNEQS